MICVVRFLVCFSRFRESIRSYVAAFSFFSAELKLPKNIVSFAKIISSNSLDRRTGFAPVMISCHLMRKEMAE